MSPIIKKIYKKDNDYQHIEVLKRNRYKRFKYKKFFVEGVEPINQALKNNWDVISFIYSKENNLSDWAKNILDNSTAKVHYEMSKELMDSISDKNNPSELLAILSMPSNDLSKIKIHKTTLIVVFDRPSDRGNLGTIIRSCSSFNVDGLIITGHCVDLYDPKVIRSSLGSFFSMPVLRLESYKKLIPWFNELKKTYKGFQIIGTSVHTDIDIVDHNFNKPTILLIGNETYGLSRNYQELSDTIVKIPIYGVASSLNVASATSIVLYEIDRQRRLYL